MPAPKKRSAYKERVAIRAKKYAKEHYGSLMVNFSKEEKEKFREFADKQQPKVGEPRNKGYIPAGSMSGLAKRILLEAMDKSLYPENTIVDEGQDNGDDAFASRLRKRLKKLVKKEQK